jgi:hypothetical protein
MQEPQHRDKKPEHMDFACYSSLESESILRNELFQLVASSVSVAYTFVPGGTSTHHGLLEIILHVSTSLIFTSLNILTTNINMLTTYLEMFFTNLNMLLI